MLSRGVMMSFTCLSDKDMAPVMMSASTWPNLFTCRYIFSSFENWRSVGGDGHTHNDDDNNKSNSSNNNTKNNNRGQCECGAMKLPCSSL
jgi:hypothetical protein